ncbi:MAG: aminopeptidase P family protein [Candidatus Kapabacteria bacterium]|nr:aminopeptidase P family protein [Candidatus Kapabacteria bacterium]
MRYHDQLTQWLCAIALSIVLAASAIAQTFPYEVFDKDLPAPSVYKARREQLLTSMAARTACIVLSADVRNRQNDVDFEYRQSSDMLYMCGSPAPGSTLLLVKDGVTINGRSFTEILFIPERKPEREVWQGVSMGPAEAMQYLGVDTAIVTKNMKWILDSIVKNLDTLAVSTLPTRSLGVPLAGKNLYAEGEIKRWLKEANPQCILKTPIRAIAEMREVKDTCELRLLRKAIDISMKGHLETMKGARPGMKEYELEALMEYTFKRKGAQDVGYPSIVGSNYNACILHYTANRRATEMNDLVLADCGAEYHGYTADITRTFPMTGRFTKDQRTIYEIVLEAQDSGIAASTMGSDFRAPHAAAMRVVERRLRELGIITTMGEADEVKRYFMHGTSHYLGLDVHDPGTGGPLKANSVITVEPGVYIPAGSPCDKRWWNIGVRIEDDILITPEGPVNLSGALARTAEDIERLMTSDE